MSQPGGVDAVRRSVSPGSLKRKRGLADYTSSRLAQNAAKSAQLTTSASSAANSRIPTGPVSASKYYRSPDSDEPQYSESGDLLHGVGSASSLTSAASSVFSHGSHSTAQNRASSLANGHTPLTNHTESSPAKTFSPSAAQASAAMFAPKGTLSAPTMSPSEASTSRNERTPMHLPAGKVKGYRAVFDPELVSGLKKEEKKKATFIKKEFGLEVRKTFHTLTT